MSTLMTHSDIADSQQAVFAAMQEDLRAWLRLSKNCLYNCRHKIHYIDS
jgi:hypothetical protein